MNVGRIMVCARIYPIDQKQLTLGQLRPMVWLVFDLVQANQVGARLDMASLVVR
jgi:hypothetical protein